MSKKQALAAAKRGGQNAEHHVISAVDALEPVAGEEHYDALAKNPVFPSEELPARGICAVESGLPVEIKSTMVVYGEAQRRGRFKLRKNQHEALVDAGGVYIFAVCEPRPERPIIALKLMAATSVGGLVDEVASWRDELDSRGPKAQLAWSNVFDPVEVERGEQP